MPNKLLTVLLDVAVRYLPAIVAGWVQRGPRKHRMDATGTVCLACGMDLRDPADQRWKEPCRGVG